MHRRIHTGGPIPGSCCSSVLVRFHFLGFKTPPSNSHQVISEPWWEKQLKSCQLWLTSCSADGPDCLCDPVQAHSEWSKVIGLSWPRADQRHRWADSSSSSSSCRQNSNKVAESGRISDMLQLQTQEKMLSPSHTHTLTWTQHLDLGEVHLQRLVDPHQHVVSAEVFAGDRGGVDVHSHRRSTTDRHSQSVVAAICFPLTKCCVTHLKL